MHVKLLDELLCPFTKQPLRLEPFALADDRVEYGLLRSEAGTFPVLCGIPVLQPRQERVVELLRSGDHRKATAVAAFGSLSRSRIRKLLAYLERGRTRPVVEAVDRWIAARQQERGMAAIFGSDGDAVRRILTVGYLSTVSPLAEAYRYFSYRYGIPRHLVGLSFIEWLPLEGATVVDLGCGAGHLTRSLTTRAERVIGLDGELFLLLAARLLAPEAELICSDARHLPLRDGVIDVCFSSDVFSFIDWKWGAVREVERALADRGWMAFTSVKNARCDHVYAGDPLSPQGWRRLVEHLDHRVVPDRVVLDRYLEGLGPPMAEHWDDDALTDQQLLSIVATRDGRGFRDGGRFARWPHAHGTLGVNPLYQVDTRDDDAVTYRRRFPSVSYERDNAWMRDYLPEQFSVARSSVRRAQRGEIDDAMEASLASVAVLGLPPALASDPWPGMRTAERRPGAIRPPPRPK